MHTAAWRCLLAGEGSKQKDSFVCHQLIMKRRRETHPPARKCLSFNMMTESRLMRLSLKALQQSSNMSDCQDWCEMQFCFKCHDGSVINQNLCSTSSSGYNWAKLIRWCERMNAHLSALGVSLLSNFRGLYCMWWTSDTLSEGLVYFTMLSKDAQI